ncbi:hypothetical protein RB5AMG_02080 [Ruminococcus bromii]|mgnify:FL=1|nr:hypothetical protein [Ruminococcus bromii]PKD27391.1 hypothetical protein RB5AMG_02080 [Ruminococcus bromii]DAP46836.1 MAG TPA: hypothetical protein [Caudoviricetes sp.]
MGFLKVAKSNIPDGDYYAEIIDCSSKDDKVVISFKLEDGTVFRPYGIKAVMSETNPLYIFLNKCGLSDEEIEDLSTEDLIGTQLNISVKNRQGEYVNFCNITNMEPLIDEIA